MLVQTKTIIMGTIDAWLAARCIRDQARYGMSADLYYDWLEFTKPQWPHSMKAFAQAMDEYGFLKIRKARGICYIGLALNDPNEEFRASFAEAMAAERIKDGEV